MIDASKFRGVRIALTGEAKDRFDATLRKSFPGMDIQRARVYEMAPDTFEVRLQVLGPGREQGRECITADQNAELHRELMPAIRDAKAHNEKMREQAAGSPGSPPEETFDDDESDDER